MANIYTANGTLDGSRNVSLGGNNLAFDTDKLFIDGSDGNVGIGTSSPSGKLEVKTDTTVTTYSNDITGSGTATASSEFDATNSADRAFDDQTTTSGWGNTNSLPS